MRELSKAVREGNWRPEPTPTPAVPHELARLEAGGIRPWDQFPLSFCVVASDWLSADDLATLRAAVQSAMNNWNTALGVDVLTVRSDCDGVDTASTAPALRRNEISEIRVVPREIRPVEQTYLAEHDGPGLLPSGESDIAYPWHRFHAVGGRCLPGTIEHELGHSLGLAHSLDPESIMYPSTDCGTRQAIRAEEIEALRATWGLD